MFTCSEETKETLENWAEEEGRTVSNMVERIVLEAIATKNKRQQEKK
jgi:CopG-like RHH_1 or ribbon-helix-helix domain, RHH_5